MKLNKKQISALIAETIAAQYEHIDIMEVYTEDDKKYIRFSLYTYDIEDDNVEENYRIAYCEDCPETSLEDYITVINSNDEDDIDSTLVSESCQYINDYSNKEFVKELSSYISDNNVKLLFSKYDLNLDTPDGEYLFLLDSDVKTFKKNMQKNLCSCIEPLFD